MAKDDKKKDKNGDDATCETCGTGLAIDDDEIDEMTDKKDES